MYCNKCSKQIKDTDNFCMYCGNKINNSFSAIDNKNDTSVCVCNNVSKTTSIENKDQLVDFGDWYVSISFAKSSSSNFPQAVGLAKMAPRYIENNIDGQILHQAVYSQEPKEYLMFIKLYELVSNWKSCYVIINGELVDRKIIQGLNYCYGDKCRSGNKNFCFGASYMTENIFGCHRLQISACNHPLYLFYTSSMLGTYKLDKQALIERILEKSKNYNLCPCFNYNNIINIVNSLPQVISYNQYKKLM